MTITRRAVAALISVAAATTLAAPAQADAQRTVSSAAVPSAAVQSAPSSGWNDWTCKPSSQHPRPVVLAHGLGANAQTNWIVIAPALRKAGYCVFSTTYGGTSIAGDLVGGLGPMEKSAKTFGDFVDRVRTSTGSAKVDVVGHSEGSTVPAYYLKLLGGASKVKNFIAFGSNYRGTTLLGLGTLAKILGLQGVLEGVGCPACAQFLPGSDFLKELNDGGVTVPGPRYVTIVSKLDTVVTPYTSGLLDEPGVTNVVLQDSCRLDAAGHVGMAIDPNVVSRIKHYLDPRQEPTPICVPFFALGA